MIMSLGLIFAWLYVLRWARHSGWGIAALTLIGTFAHEALHLIVGLVVNAKPTSFSIIPKRQKNCWVLGSVGFRNLNIWNSAPTAFASLLLAWGAWIVFREWTQPAFRGEHYLSWLVSGYVAAVGLFSSVPSHIDIRMGVLSAIMYICIAGMLWFILSQI
jgi:hypothetical protein